MGTPPSQASEPSPEIVLVVADYASSTVTLVRSDRKEATFPLTPSPVHPGSRISKATYVPTINVLQLETTLGDTILAELPTLADPAPLRGRPVVYLDQKDWSQLANTLHQPEKVPAGDREAAEILISWARDKKIILPMSSAHMSETCKWTDDDARYRLALTIAQLSAGWQMREPIEVRRFELRQSFTTVFKNACLLPPATFTLEPYAIEGETGSLRHRLAPADFPPDVALATRALTSISSYIDTMLDADPVATTPTPGWVTRNQRFTDWIAGESSRTPAQKRESIDVLFLADTRELAEEAHRSDITPDDMRKWMLQHRHEELLRMPSLGLFREVLHGKVLNPGTRWTDNDLIDMIYLTCATAYADYVVGERSLVSQMEQALKRLGRSANLYRRTRDLVAVLQQTGL